MTKLNKLAYAFKISLYMLRNKIIDYFDKKHEGPDLNQQYQRGYFCFPTRK